MANETRIKLVCSRKVRRKDSMSGAEGCEREVIKVLRQIMSVVRDRVGEGCVDHTKLKAMYDL